jgi:hypothetical protein
MPTRLSDMEYDEVSLVDAGANDDGDGYGAQVMLMKRAPREDSGGTVSTRSSTASSPRTVKRKKGTSTRADHWKDDRHPRNPKGPGGGEFKSTSAESKKKYGKGGTAKDNLPKEYETSNKDAKGLQRGISDDQKKMLDADKAKKGAAAQKKKDAAQKKRIAQEKKRLQGESKKIKERNRAEKQKQTAQQREAARQASAINSLADNQRTAYKQQGKPVPKGFSWSGNRLLPTADAQARSRAAAGLPAPTKTSSAKGSTGKKLVLGPDGKFRWVNVSKSEMSTGGTSVTVREKALVFKWLNLNEKEGAS